MTEEIAIFAGGCFWCTQAAFAEMPGVKHVESGYTGGQVEDPDYEAVCSGKTGHYEGVMVVFDPEKVTYEELLEIFWHSIDPTDPGGQFADRGTQYKTVIFYTTEEQKEKAERSKQQVAEDLDEEIATEILPSEEFYTAEEYHQDYHRKCPIRYKMYKHGSGRVRRLDEIWG